MSFKENDEFASLTSELKKDFAKEAELLSKIYDWFNEIAVRNKSVVAKISPQDLQKIGELTHDEAEDIESRTNESGLSALVDEYVLAKHKKIEGKKKLSELWPKIIENLTK